MRTTGLRRVVEAVGCLCMVGCLTSTGRAENGPSGSTTAAEQLKIRCECSQVSNDGAACRDITAVLQSEIVTWYEQAPASAGPDWTKFCFERHDTHPAAHLACCDHQKDGDTWYYRGTAMK